MSDELVIIQDTQVTQMTTSADIQNIFSNKESFDMVLRGALALSKSTIVPAMYQKSPENCFIAIDMSNRMGISPMVVMQNLYIVQGKPSWSGQACKMLIESSGKFTNLKHVYTGEKGKDNWGCYMTAIRKADSEIVNGAEVTIEIAKKEGWYSKGASKWQTIPELMLAYRAAAWFARVHTPESLMGMSTAEESEDIAKESRKVVDVL